MLFYDQYSGYPKKGRIGVTQDSRVEDRSQADNQCRCPGPLRPIDQGRPDFEFIYYFYTSYETTVGRDHLDIDDQGRMLDR